ncbi:MAG: YjbF family lipoprotein [Alphaproteobacteria bacterium]|nr:YjbF family lipoprotein [Alphaproteobacteria bacterium]
MRDRLSLGRVLPLLPLVLLAGCEDSDLGQLAQLAYTSVTSTPPKIGRDQAAAIPYASMGLELGDTAQVLLVLGTETGNELDWFAGDQVFLRTRNGKVIRTVGLPYDLGGLRQLDPVSGMAKPASATAVQYSFDFPDLGIFDAIAQCTTRDAGNATVEIFGSQLPTRHTIEHCSVPDMRWNFDNEYWTDPMTGYVWRSSQHIHPDSPPVVLQVFRPAQNPG